MASGSIWMSIISAEGSKVEGSEEGNERIEERTEERIAGEELDRDLRYWRRPLRTNLSLDESVRSDCRRRDALCLSSSLRSAWSAASVILLTGAVCCNRRRSSCENIVFWIFGGREWKHCKYSCTAVKSFPGGERLRRLPVPRAVRGAIRRNRSLWRVLRWIGCCTWYCWREEVEEDGDIILARGCRRIESGLFAADSRRGWEWWRGWCWAVKRRKRSILEKNYRMEHYSLG